MGSSYLVSGPLLAMTSILKESTSSCELRREDLVKTKDAPGSINFGIQLLVLKWSPIDAFSAATSSLSGITALNHETVDDLCNPG